MTPEHSNNASMRSFDDSVQGSPFSAPAVLAASQSSITSPSPPRLPSEFENKANTDCKKVVDTQKRDIMKKVNQQFIAKSALDQDREKIAIRQANSLMNVTLGGACTAETKKLIITNKKPLGKVVIVPDGREHLATSSWKNRRTAENGNNNQINTTGDDATEFEECVDDFKCELDREREAWAQRQALRMLKGAGSFL
jgi:hypothetical protein